MVEELRFPPKVRGMLYADPFWNAMPIHRVYNLPASERDVLVDRMEDPRALMTVSRYVPRIVSVAGRGREALQDLIDSLDTSGECRFHAVDRTTADIVRRRFDITSDNPSWFYTLREKDFVGDIAHEVSPLVPEDAETMNQYWNPGEDSRGYIRSRIKSGLGFGIRVEGELVAWDATHLETDQAVMLGFLHVVEGFRKQGFARSITTTMVRTVFGKGKTPICHVFSDNEPSIKLTEEMGFKRKGEQVWLRTATQ